MFKRITAVVLALMILTGTMAFAQTRMFSGRGLGADIMISDDWFSKDQSKYVGMWRRVDEDIKSDDLFGYGMIYIIPQDASVPSLTSQDETEEWLNQNCVAVGGIITHREGYDTSAIYPQFDRRELPPSGNTHFTLIRPSNIDVSLLNDEAAAMAKRVYEGLNDDKNYVTYDMTENYGFLGKFEAQTLNGNVIDNDYIKDSELTIAYFWATYCSPCISTMKKFSDVVDKYADRGVRALGIVLDVSPYDASSIESAKLIADKQGVTFENIPMALGSEVLMKIYSTPTYVLLDSEGNQLGDMIIGSRSESEYSKIIESYLK